MYHKGLNRQLIIDTAAEMISTDGLEKFSLHSLASKLGVRTASLYTHVSGLDDVVTEVGLYALNLQKDAQMSRMEGKTGKDAVFAVAEGYRAFALENKEFYKIIMNMQSVNEQLKKGSITLSQPPMEALRTYPLNEDEIMHWQRILRSIMHGFVDHEHSGYFIHFEQPKEESYRMAVQCFVDGLEAYISQR